DEYRPVLGATVEAALENISAGAAIAWYDESYGSEFLHLARLSSNPLAMAQTEAGSFLFNSEMWKLEEVAEAFGLELTWQDYAEQGSFFIVRNGTIIRASSFEPLDYYTSFRRNGWRS